MVNEGSDLAIAKTIIHETLHAYIQYEIDKNKYLLNKNDFYQNLKIAYDNNNSNGNLSEHDFMTQFVEAMAYSLAEYDNYQQSMDYYRAMSWGGLETSSAYQAKTQQEKDNIQKIICNERFYQVGGNC